jgi:PKD repeat protein
MRGSRLLRLLVSVSFAASAGVSVQALTAAPAAAATAAVPRPDHVVIVVEENRGFGTVLGSPNAPFINSLAAAGADFTQSFAETHPSQPNYLALFSGSTQGLTDDSCPHTYTAGDLGSQLIAAGFGFAGYSESLPSVGYTGCGSGKYARKHAPWVNFSNLAASTNQPFTAFPTDYSLLPEVSFVIPNLDNDMHDGTVAQGDQWLQNNLGGYITWAQTHNSVFVLTFDEDEGTSPNQIPTIITGQGVVPGSYAETINHYNLLRTLEDAYGLAPLGAAASAAPIVDIWAPPSGNQPPVAAFTSSCDQLGCSFDGSGSADPDGSISSYAWDFGDGATAGGSQPAHAFAAAGSYPVQLTVTDGEGASSAVTRLVRAGSGPPVTFAGAAHGPAGSVRIEQATMPVQADSGDTAVLVFTRAVTSSWSGPSGVSGWTLLDTFTNGSIVSSVWTKAVASGDAGQRVRFDSPVYAKGVLEVAVYANAVTVAAVLAHSGDAGPNVHVTPTVPVPPGSTVVSFWSEKSDTSTSWTAPPGVSVRDATLGTGGGRYSGLLADSGGPVSGGNYGTLSASTDASSSRAIMWTIALPPVGGAPANQPPVAAFANSCASLACTFDASGSSDPDGTIASYAWSFGDGGTAGGVSPAHTFASGGTYGVQLTVTDGAGSTGTLTRSITVSSGTATVIAFVGAAHGPPGAVLIQQVRVPASAQAGDTAVLFFTRSATATWSGPSGLSGWTALDSFVNGSIVSGVWVRTIAASDAGQPVRFDSAAYGKGTLQLAVYAHAAANSAVAYAGDSGQSAHRTPMVSAPPGCRVVSAWADKSDTTTGWTVPSEVTARDVALGAGSGRYNGLLADAAGPVAVGDYGGMVASAGVSSRAAMWTVSLAASG